MTIKDSCSGDDTIAVRLNVLGLICPLPLIHLQAEIEALAPGEVLELLADDPGTADDLPAWSEQTGHRILDLTAIPEGWRARIQKCSVTGEG